jgi:hypothetical protein
MARSATLLVCLVSCMYVMSAHAGTYEILQDTSKQHITWACRAVTWVPRAHSNTLAAWRSHGLS